MPNIHSIYFSLAILLYNLATSSHTLLLAQTAMAPAVPQQPANIYRDPRTGLEYRYATLQERRIVPQWVTENRRVTQTQYVPYTQYELQSRWVGRWNPFAQPQVQYEYVPITQWQAKQVEVDVPITYQKYVAQDQVVTVPEMIPPGTLASNLPTQQVPAQQVMPSHSGSMAPPMSTVNDPRQNTAALAAVQANQQRFATNQPKYALVPMRNTSSPTTGYYPNQPAVPLGSLAVQPLINPAKWFQGRSAATNGYVPNGWNGTQPLFQPMLANNSRTGPFNAAPQPKGFFRSVVNTSPPLPPPAWQGTVAWNGNPPMAYGGNQSAMFSNAGRSNSLSPTLRPSTAQNIPQTAGLRGDTFWRDPNQTGLRASELR